MATAKKKAKDLGPSATNIVFISNVTIALQAAQEVAKFFGDLSQEMRDRRWTAANPYYWSTTKFSYALSAMAYSHLANPYDVNLARAAVALLLLLHEKQEQAPFSGLSTLKKLNLHQFEVWALALWCAQVRTGVNLEMRIGNLLEEIAELKRLEKHLRKDTRRKPSAKATESGGGWVKVSSWSILLGEACAVGEFLAKMDSLYLHESHGEAATTIRWLAEKMIDLGQRDSISTYDIIVLRMVVDVLCRVVTAEVGFDKHHFNRWVSALMLDPEDVIPIFIGDVEFEIESGHFLPRYQP